MEGWIRSDSLPHLYKLDRKIQALSRKCNEVQAELSLAKVDQQRLCNQLRAQNETIKDVRDLMMKTKAETGIESNRVIGTGKWQNLMKSLKYLIHQRSFIK